ncbi:MAG: hypothetical protein M3O25_08930 [Actinomycetota bacterium]|nr:hypothetical protein [Actinomycetota bacterium]
MAEPQLRAVLLVAGAGAVLVLVNLFGTGGALAGLAAMAIAALLSRSASRSALGDLDWWRLLAAGTALVAIGIPVGLGLETIGGLLTAAGAALGVIAVALALP